MEKALVAQRLANQVASTENAVDAAIKETSQLLAGMLDARQELKLSAVFGDDAALAELKLRAGIRTKLNVTDKPAQNSAEHATVSALRAG
jgi:hypothetical protein